MLNSIRKQERNVPKNDCDNEQKGPETEHKVKNQVLRDISNTIGNQEKKNNYVQKSRKIDMSIKKQLFSDLENQSKQIKEKIKKRVTRSSSIVKVSQIKMFYKGQNQKSVKYMVFEEDSLCIPEHYRKQITHHTIDDDIQTDEEQLKLAQRFCVRELNDAVEEMVNQNTQESKSESEDDSKCELLDYQMAQVQAYCEAPTKNILNSDDQSSFSSQYTAITRDQDSKSKSQLTEKFWVQEQERHLAISK